MKLNWIQTILGHIAKIEQGYTFNPQHQGNQAGKWPYAKVGDLGNNYKYLHVVSNYVDDKVLHTMNATPFKKGTVVFPRVGAALRTNRKRILPFDCMVDDNLLALYPIDTSILTPDYLFHWLCNTNLENFCNSGNVPSINQRSVFNTEIVLPTVSEQIEICKLLDTWDSIIDKIKGLSQINYQKEAALAAALYSPDKKSAFSTLDEFCTEISIRNRKVTDRVLSVTNQSGFVLPEEQFAKRIASDDISSYKIVRKGQYAYNPSRINVGSIARLDDWDIGALSPMYTVFSIDEGRIDSDYFLHWLKSPRARFAIAKSAQGSVRTTVAYSDLSEIEILLPNLSEQRRIARILNSAREETRILRDLAERYKQQKTFLMSKLLSGEWEAPNLGAEAN